MYEIHITSLNITKNNFQEYFGNLIKAKITTFLMCLSFIMEIEIRVLLSIVRK